jgi:hypothetical protein
MANVCQKVKKYLKGAKPFRAFSAKFPNVTQMIQLTFIYFAVIDLLYAVLNNVFSLGYVPEILGPVFPLISAILQSPILKFGQVQKRSFLILCRD